MFLSIHSLVNETLLMFACVMKYNKKGELQDDFIDKKMFLLQIEILKKNAICMWLEFRGKTNRQTTQKPGKPANES